MKKLTLYQKLSLRIVITFIVSFSGITIEDKYTFSERQTICLNIFGIIMIIMVLCSVILEAINSAFKD